MRLRPWDPTVFLSALFVMQLFSFERAGAMTACEWAKDNYLEKLQELARQQDVSQIINQTQICNPRPAAIPFPKLLKIAKQGYFAEAKYVLNRADAASNYRDVSKDLAEYERIMRLADGEAFIKTESATRLKKRGILNKDNSKKNCGAVDLRPKFGKVRDQDTIGWCYAFVAADMIQFKTGIHVSAADIAVNYTSAHSDAPWRRIFSSVGELGREGGRVDLAIQEMIKPGVCRESDFPSEYSGQELDLRTFVEFVEKASEKDRVAYLTGGLFGSNHNQKFFSNGQVCTSASAFKLSPSQLQRLNEIADRSIGSRAFYDLAKKSCEGKRLPIQVPPLDFRSQRANHSIKEQFKFMDAKLDKNLPLAMTWRTDLAKGERDPSNSWHVSTVVGRRVSPKTGMCEYLVRNSWGKACPYPDYDCEEGNVWLPREALHQSIDSVEAF